MGETAAGDNGGGNDCSRRRQRQKLASREHQEGAWPAAERIGHLISQLQHRTEITAEKDDMTERHMTPHCHRRPENHPAMSRKRMEYRQPRKLTAYFTQLLGLQIQDGACGLHRDDGSYTDLPDADPPETSLPRDETAANPSSMASSTQNSPVKSQMRLDSDPRNPEVSSLMTDIPTSIPQPSPIAAFPTSNQPVLDTTVKEMLISLQISLHVTISSMFMKLSSEMHSLGNKVSQIDNQVGAITGTVNKLVDAHEHTRNEHQWMRVKMADLKERLRRNNVKICGIPESILPPDLNSYTRRLISTILPELSPMETIIGFTVYLNLLTSLRKSPVMYY